MSGPKCARADLDARRQAELRLQRERERLVGEARAACLADERCLAKTRANRAEARLRLDELRLRVEAFGSSTSAGVVMPELDSWTRDYELLETDLSVFDSELFVWGKRFDQARETWSSDPERYDRVMPSTLRFDDIARLATISSGFGDRLARLAASRRSRDDREAQEAAGRVRAAVEERDRLATAAADHIRVRRLVDETLADVDYSDREFLEKWAPESLNELDADVQSLRTDLDEIVVAGRPVRDAELLRTRCEGVRSLLESVKCRANDEYAREESRVVVVDALIDALDSLHFNVSARLERQGDVRSDVLIRAGHSSGQEISLDVQPDRTVRMLLEDGQRGADCVADVLGLVDALREAGVTLAVTDWGTTAHPDRIRSLRRDVNAASVRNVTDPAS